MFFLVILSIHLCVFAFLNVIICQDSILMGFYLIKEDKPI